MQMKTKHLFFYSYFKVFGFVKFFAVCIVFLTLFLLSVCVCVCVCVCLCVCVWERDCDTAGDQSELKQHTGLCIRRLTTQAHSLKYNIILQVLLLIQVQRQQGAQMTDTRNHNCLWHAQNS